MQYIINNKKNKTIPKNRRNTKKQKKENKN